MHIGKFEKKVGVWQYGIAFNKRNYDCFNIIPNVKIWFFNLQELPGEGEATQKKHYKGFIFYRELRHDIIVKRRFILPDFQLVLIPRGYKGKRWGRSAGHYGNGIRIMLLGFFYAKYALVGFAINIPIRIKLWITN